MTAKDANILVALLANMMDATCRRVAAAPSLNSRKHPLDVSLSCFCVTVVYTHYLSSVTYLLFTVRCTLKRVTRSR